MNHVILKERRVRRVKQLTTMIPGTVLILRKRNENFKFDEDEKAIFYGKKIARTLPFHILFSKQYLDDEGREVFYILSDRSSDVKRTLMEKRDWSQNVDLITFDLYDNSNEVCKGFTPNIEFDSGSFDNQISRRVEYTLKQM